MKNKFLSTLFILLFCQLLINQLIGQEPFYVSYPLGFSTGSFLSVEEHPSGGYLALGRANSWDEGDKIVLVKFSDEGESVWEKRFSRHERANRWPVKMAIGEKADCFYILLGNVNQAYGNPHYNSVMKVDLEGDSLWQVDVSPIHEWSAAIMRDIIASDDGGCLVVSGSRNSGRITKVSESGEIEWIIHPGSQNNWFKAVQDVENNYFVAGYQAYTRPAGGNGDRLSVVKMDEGGTIIWERQFYSGFDDDGDKIKAYGNDVLPMAEGGCIVVGDLQNPEWNAGFMMRLDQNGDSLWTQKYYVHPTKKASALRIIPAWGCYGVFLHQNAGNTQAEARLLKVTEDGILWSQKGYNYRLSMQGKQESGELLWTGYDENKGVFIRSSPDGMFHPPIALEPGNGEDVRMRGSVIFRWMAPDHDPSSYRLQLSQEETFADPQQFLGIKKDTTSFEVENLLGATQYFWRIRAQGPEDGYSAWSEVFSFNTIDVSGMEEQTLESSLLVYPTPADESVKLNFHIKSASGILLTISSMQGKVVRQQRQDLLAGENQIVVDVKSLPNGVYLCQLKGPDESVVQKLLISH